MKQEVINDLYTDDSNVLERADETGGENKSKKKRISNKAIAIIAVIVAVLGFFVIKGSQVEDTSSESGFSNIKGDNKGVNVSEEVGTAHTGTENATNTTGTGAILAFDWAYYKDRDGEKALQFFDPANQDYDGDYVQRYIDRVSPATSYDLEITPESLGEKYSVVLTLTLPGYEPVKYRQSITTVKTGDKFYIKEMSSNLMTDDD